MSESIRVSSEFREVLEAHRRDGETLEETIRRLVGGPHPEALETIVGTDGETAAELREAIERKRDEGRDRRSSLRDRFD